MKERLDVLLVKRGLAKSRENAKEMILEGGILVQGRERRKPGEKYEADETEITVQKGGLLYVSRGGLKLEKALTEFCVSLAGKVCMDIGASTGGFTDCMLKSGAARVYAVDAGHGQLARSLLGDCRVINMEGTNFRYITGDDVKEDLDFISVDVSFISLTKILTPAHGLLKAGGQMVCLIKPQFEAGRDKVGKKGVVREPEIHEEVIHKIVIYAELVGFSVKGLTFSPVKGPEGNIEYLIYLEKKESLSEEVIRLTEQEAEKALQEMLSPEMKTETEPGAEPPVGEAMRQLISDTVNAAHQALNTDRDERE